MKRLLLWPMFCVVLPLHAQIPVPVEPIEQLESRGQGAASIPPPVSLLDGEYRIGPDDVLSVDVFEVPELKARSRVSAAGEITLPLLGPITAAGLTARELELAIEEALRKRYVKEPRVTVMVEEFGPQPVAVVGAVKIPGIYHIRGSQNSLLDLLAMAQGLELDAGKVIQILRRRPGREPENISIDAEDLFQNGRSELNIEILPGDAINVLRAGSIFVIGEVAGPGEFVLRQGREVTVTQAVALGGGFNPNAKKQECVVIRFHRDGTREEIPVDVQKILEEGTESDVPLLVNDILFVPSNSVRSGLMRALDAAVSIVSARLIFLGRR